jgi:hypothetical protein
MPRLRTHIRLLFVLAICVASLTSTNTAGAKGSSYQTGFTRWRAADGAFSGWQRSGVVLTGGALQLDPITATAGTDTYSAGGYNGHNFYNGGAFLLGEATSPTISTGFAFTEAIASWNATTPAGSWIETQIRAQLAGRWTKWYSLGVWADDNSTVERHSVNLQGDTDGFVAVDTLVLTNKKAPASAVQIKLRLFRADGSSATPSVRNASIAYSTTSGKASTVSAGDKLNWGTLLSVPQCSQMVYPDGGEVWCSPTSTSMVLGYWSQDTGPCEPRVRAAVEGVHDWLYDGHGNWPFNTAYAATQGLEGYVARFSSLNQVEKWVKAGVPVVFSFAWNKSELDGAAIPSSNGHLAVIVGFDATGNPIVNDPAAASDSDVRRTYDRAQLEALWLENSGGTVYLIYPSGTAVQGL